MSNGNTAVIAKALARVTYKPGWKLSLALNPANAPMQIGWLIVEVEAQDSRYPFNPPKIVKVTHQLPIPGMFDWDEPEAIVWIWQQILGVETHEAAEFFRVDGELIRDPHRGGPGS